MNIGWSLGLFCVNVIFLAMMIPLLRRPPCWMQFVVSVVYTVVLFVVSVGYLGRMLGAQWADALIFSALFLEHLGVLIWIWRMSVQREQRKEAEWISSPAPGR